MDERIWRNEVVEKLRKEKLVREVSPWEIHYDNLSTVSLNGKMKKILCLDFSRLVNYVAENPCL